MNIVANNYAKCTLIVLQKKPMQAGIRHRIAENFCWINILPTFETLLSGIDFCQCGTVRHIPYYHRPKKNHWQIRISPTRAGGGISDYTILFKIYNATLLREEDGWARGREKVECRDRDGGYWDQAGRKRKRVSERERKRERGGVAERGREHISERGWEVVREADG